VFVASVTLHVDTDWQSVCLVQLSSKLSSASPTLRQEGLAIEKDNKIQCLSVCNKNNMSSLVDLYYASKQTSFIGLIITRTRAVELILVKEKWCASQ